MLVVTVLLLSVIALIGAATNIVMTYRIDKLEKRLHEDE